MSRIRSVHPGFFTDEGVASVSMGARLLLIGLGIEADDKGVFEWKPLRLKMRLFPADAVDIPSLLDELTGECDLVRRFETEGRSYGAIRNFRKHQRPKTPNNIHPAPPDILNYVGLSDGISEKQPGKRDQFPPKGEISPQMEDGGGRMEDGEEDADASSGDIDPPSKPKRKPKAVYPFEGKAFRLNQADFDEWKALYHGIPDLAAELPNVDNWLLRNPKDGRNNFHAASGMLNRKHQAALRDLQALAAPPGSSPFDRYLRDEPSADAMECKQ